MDYCVILKLHETLNSQKLRLPKLLALLYIEANPDSKISDLKYPIGQTQAGLTCLMESLEKDGLVKRIRCDSNLRNVLLHLTGKGTETLKEYRKLIAK